MISAQQFKSDLIQALAERSNSLITTLMIFQLAQQNRPETMDDLTYRSVIVSVLQYFNKPTICVME